MLLLAPLFLPALWPCLPPAPSTLLQEASHDEVVRLRDGRLLIGEILEHDLDGMVLLSAQNGGRYALTWSDMFPGEANRLMLAFGYKTETSMPMVSADRVLLVNGTELVGRILRKDEKNLELRMRDTTSVIPLLRLAGPPEKVLVEAPQVLTPAQFYAETMDAVDATDPLALYQYAGELELVFALDEAQLTYGQAEALIEDDPALLRRIQGAQTQLAITIANRAEAELIEHIRHMIHREDYNKAEEAMESYGELFPEPALAGDFLDVSDKFETSRTESLERHLARHWFSRASVLIKRKALDRNASVDSLLSWVEGEMPILLRDRMLEELQEMHAEVDPSLLDAMWANRSNHRVRSHSAGFGNGTWILGEERARAGLDKTDDAEDDGKTAQQKEMEERMRRFLENQERARRGAAGSSGEAVPEDWWRKASSTERFQFLLAYYGEFSGDFELKLASFENCSTCAGSGVIKTLEIGAQGGKERRTKCTLCQGVGVKRRVTFR